MFYKTFGLHKFSYVFFYFTCASIQSARIPHKPYHDMEASGSQFYTDFFKPSYLYALAGLSLDSHDENSAEIEDSMVEGSETVQRKTLGKPVAFSYYKNDEVPDLTVAASDKQSPRSGHHHGQHSVKGGGKKHYSVHHAAHGEKGRKGYEGFHEEEKGAKGHHDKEGHVGHYSDKGGRRKSHHHEDGYHGMHHKGDKGKKGAKYEENGKHSKGHSTKGGHNVHKNDVFEKKTVFFDEHHEGGESEKHGGFHFAKKHKKGGKKKGGHKKGGHHEVHHGKKGHFAKGGHHKEQNGHKKNGGHHGHHKHEEKYGKQGSQEHHKKWGHKKGGKHGGSKSAPQYSPSETQNNKIVVDVKDSLPRVEATDENVYFVPPSTIPEIIVPPSYGKIQTTVPRLMENYNQFHTVENQPIIQQQESLPNHRDVIISPLNRNDNFEYQSNLDGQDRKRSPIRESFGDGSASEIVRKRVKNPARKRLLIALHDER